jgi:DNA-binding NarL/FixJ family response regulator
MPREKSPEQKEAWAAYMREYRRRTKATGTHDPRGQHPTARQIEVLRAYADPKHGGTQKAVAERLGISVSAVNNTLQRLTKRLGVKDPAQAVFLLRHEMEDLDTNGAPP